MSVAVVTGAGRGLGRLVAERLARRGQWVLCTDIDAEAAAETARHIGPQAWSMAHDVRDPEAHRAVAGAASARGPLAVWVNNAGVLRASTAWGHSDAEVALQVQVNVLGVMYGSRAAIETMQHSGGGHIINLASLSALLPTPGLAVYGASKWAVLGYSISLAGDLQQARLPIRVSAICPDAIDTDMVRDVAGQKESALLFAGTRLLSPERVADVTVGVLDDYQLVVVYPRSRGALARVMAHFPGLELKVLGQLRRLGERQRRRHRATS